MLICPPWQDGARALVVLGVDNVASGPPELLALEQEQVVVPDASPQRTREGRDIWGQRLLRDWDQTLSPWEGGYW